MYGVSPFVGGLSLLVQLASAYRFLVYITSERRFGASNIRWLDLGIDWPVLVFNERGAHKGRATRNSERSLSRWVYCTRYIDLCQ